MTKIAVIIPYYQKASGILRRALESISLQRLSPEQEVEIIVVDDGSPVPAAQEVEAVEFKAQFSLTLIKQANAGVAEARNRGLRQVDAATNYIAFLDSDDWWQEEHLSQGVRALEKGHDFYFCDNRRQGHHESHFASGEAALMSGYIKSHKNDGGIVSLTKNEIASVVLREFPTQLSTVVYRKEKGEGLRFDPSFKNAGEDMLFILQLVHQSDAACFSPEARVECGEGVNIYFGNIGWDTPGHLTRLSDRLRSHVHIRDVIALSKENAAWNNKLIAKLRRDFVFHTLRQWVAHKGAWPQAARALARQDASFLLWFPVHTVQVSIGRLLKTYHPA